MNQLPAAIGFDFDGTLIDSAPGILAGMDLALKQYGLTPKVPLTSAIIGPPLLQTLALISGSQNQVQLQNLATAFKSHYDGSAYKETAPYPGISQLLARLAEGGARLFIATNKRCVPTELILNHLGWRGFFADVYCLDQHPDCANKGHLLAKVVPAQSMTDLPVPYVGDTEGDANAANQNRLPYLHVDWGYGQLPEGITAYHADTADTLYNLLVEAPWT